MSDVTRDGVVDGDGRVHVARAGAGAGGGRPVRRLLVRGGAVRAADAEAPSFRASTRRRRRWAPSWRRSRAPRQLDAGLPHDIEKVVLRCLRKHPEKRFQSMADVELELEEEAAELDAAGTGFAGRRPAMAEARVGGRRGRRSGSCRSRRRALAAVPPLERFFFHGSSSSRPTPAARFHPALSPDGRRVAFAWNGEKRATSTSTSRYRWGPTAATDHGSGRRLPPGLVPRRTRTGLPPGNPGRDRRLRGLRPRRPGEKGGRPGPDVLHTALSLVDARWEGTPRRGQRPAGGEGVYLIPLGAGERRRLTPKSKFADRSPSLSPDGRRLAYATCPSRYQCELQVLRLSRGLVPEGPPRPLGQPNTSVQGLTWSPEVKASSLRPPPRGPRSLSRRLPLTGSTTPERIDLAGELAMHPNVAGAHDLLVFTRNESDSDVWRVTDGGPPEPFITASRSNQPAFSPDGKRLAFCSDRCSDSIEVFVSSTDGAGPMQLTRGAGESGPARPGLPTADDSLRLEAADGSWDVYVVDAAGGAPRPDPEPSRRVICHLVADGRWISSRRPGPAGTRSGALPRREGTRCRSPAPAASPAKSRPTARCSTTPERELLSNSSQPLFARPVAGGDERQVLDSVLYVKSYRVVEGGLYYWTRRGSAQPGHVLPVARPRHREVARSRAHRRGSPLRPDRLHRTGRRSSSPSGSRRTATSC